MFNYGIGVLLSNVMEGVIKDVCHHYRISPTELRKSGSRTVYSQIRQHCYFELHRAGFTPRQISRRFGIRIESVYIGIGQWALNKGYDDYPYATAVKAVRANSKRRMARIRAAKKELENVEEN